MNLMLAIVTLVVVALVVLVLRGLVLALRRPVRVTVRSRSTT